MRDRFALLEYGHIGNVYLHGGNAHVGLVILDSPIELDTFGSLAAQAASTSSRSGPR